MRRSTFKALTALAIGAAALGAATPAFAVKPPPPACGGFMGNFSTPASACQGFFDKNLLNDANEGAQETAVEALLGSDIVDFDFNDYTKLDSLTGDTIDFGEQLFGDVIIGIHFGAANGDPIHVGGNGATGFFLFHFDHPVDFITTSIGGLSGAVLYANQTPPPPQVPEPATWAMMLLGFGATGFAMRRRRQNTLPQIA